MSNSNQEYTEDKGGVKMSPAIKLIEQERLSYINGMKQYLENLKELSDVEIKSHSREVLIDAEIIDDDGNLMNYHLKSKRK